MVRAFLMEADPNVVHISIADTGRGINPEVKAMIFERLYQDPNSIDDSRKGLGLGLYISKELVRLHGGQIWVESQLSLGSTFTFTLPLFSLAKFLYPIITEHDQLRPSLSLITVEIAPLFTPLPGNWDGIRQHCIQILQPCILQDKDVILPGLGDTGQAEAFMIVASTDEHGARVVEKRIREQLERSERLKVGCVFKVSSADLALPLRDHQEPVEKLVEKVADSISETAMGTLRRIHPFAN